MIASAANTLTVLLILDSFLFGLLSSSSAISCLRAVNLSNDFHCSTSSTHSVSQPTVLSGNQPRRHRDTEGSSSRRLANAASPLRGLTPFARRSRRGGRREEIRSPLPPTTNARERRPCPAPPDRPTLSSLRILPSWPAVALGRRRLRASVSPWFNSRLFCPLHANLFGCGRGLLGERTGSCRPSPSTRHS